MPAHNGRILCMDIGKWLKDHPPGIGATIVSLVFVYLCFGWWGSYQEFKQYEDQHDALRGVWETRVVTEENPDWYVRHHYNNGRSYIEGTWLEGGRKGKGNYVIKQINEDGSFVIETKSDWYGYRVDTTVMPVEGGETILFDGQTLKKVE